MRNNLPIDFITEMNTNGRTPLQYIVFHFENEDITLTDANSNDIPGTLKVIEDWGNLSDITNITEAVNGNGSPTRTATLTIFNIAEYQNDIYDDFNNGNFTDWLDPTCPDYWYKTYSKNNVDSSITFRGAFQGNKNDAYIEKNSETGGLRFYGDEPYQAAMIRYDFDEIKAQGQIIRIDVTNTDINTDVYVETENTNQKLMSGENEFTLLENTEYILLSYYRYNSTDDQETVINSIAIRDINNSVRIPNTPFSSLFNDNYPENIKADYYQTFKTHEGTILEGVLIGTFLCQDPIQYSESSSLMTIDLVSDNQYINPYIGKLDTLNNTFSDVIIGPNAKIPASKYNDHPIAFSEDMVWQHINYIKTTVEVGLDTLGFPESGTIIVNKERIDYTSLTDNNNQVPSVGYKNTFSGTIRNSNTSLSIWSMPITHPVNSLITLYNHEYLYSFGSGPVDNMGPCYVNDEIASGYTIYKDRDPIQVGFMHQPPVEWDISSDQYREEVTDYGVGSGGNPNDRGFWNSTYMKDNSSDTKGAGAWTKYGDHGTIYQFGWSIQPPANFMTGKNFDESLFTIVCYPYYHGDGSKSSVEFWDNHGGFDYVINSGDYSGFERMVLNRRPKSYLEMSYGNTLKFYTYYYHTDQYNSYWTGKITEFNAYLYTKLDVRTQVYTESDITCDVNLNDNLQPVLPIEAIKTVFSRMGIEQNIDTTSYEIVKTIQETKGYSFSGLIKGDKRCRDVLKDMCYQSRTNIIYNEGIIKFLYQYTIEDLNANPPDTYYVANKSNTQYNSIKILRQNVSDIVNNITIRFDTVTAENEYQQQYNEKDTDSIALFGDHQLVIDGYLIDDATMAEDIISQTIKDTAYPYIIITFNLYMNAFPLEPGDLLYLGTDFSDLGLIGLKIINIERTFGSGKLKRINTFQITAVGRTDIPILFPNLILVTDSYNELITDENVILVT